MNIIQILTAISRLLASAISFVVNCTFKLQNAGHHLLELNSFITWHYFDPAKEKRELQRHFVYYQNSSVIFLSIAIFYLAIYLFGLFGLEKNFSVKNIFDLDYYRTSPYIFMHQIYLPNVWKVMDISVGVQTFLADALFW